MAHAKLMMANSSLRANTCANISKEIANDNGELKLSDSQGDEIVSNPSVKIPVWKILGFLETKREHQRLKGRCCVVFEKKKCLLRTILPICMCTWRGTTKKNIASYVLLYLRKVIRSPRL